MFYSQTFDEWYKPDEGIVPVSSNGEVECYSLLLNLNDLGNAFLIIVDWLAEGDDFEKNTFTLE